MDLRTIIDRVADEADELLADTRDRREARDLIGDFLAAEYPALGPGDRQKAVHGVMEILENEDFFGSARQRDPWKAGENAADAD